MGKLQLRFLRGTYVISRHFVSVVVDVMRMSEKRKIHTAVCAVFDEIRVVAEVVVLAVFKHEQTIFCHNLSLHHPVGQFAQFLERVGRVGKDQVKRFAAALDETQRIAAEQRGCGVVQRLEVIVLKNSVAELCNVAFACTDI